MAASSINLKVASNVELAELSRTKAEQDQADVITESTVIGQRESVKAWRMIASRRSTAKHPPS